MAPRSPGGETRGSRRPKSRTLTAKSHRFESFSKKIARLKIDPIHRVDRLPQMNQDDPLTRSRFQSSLEYWADLNLSQNYIHFSRKIQPLCESLPQLIHHADTIFDLLCEYLDKRDSLSLEPLLSLVAHFAHDLGSRFEKYFEQVVALVAEVAASHDAPEVVEWCFTCLVWIFKFLSRLLSPDLRPLLRIMTPYLQSSKAHVARFTAESLSFLIRKAAASYSRDRRALTYAVTFLLNQVQDAPDTAALAAGVMTLLTESVTGIEGQLHGITVSLITCLCETQLGSSSSLDASLSVIEGVVTALVYHTDAEGCKPILQWLLAYMASSPHNAPEGRIVLCGRLLFIFVATRKGSRIEDWDPVLESITHQVSEMSRYESSREPCILTSVLALQYAPMSQAVFRAQSLLERLGAGLGNSEIFKFCEIFASLGHERFLSLVLHFLQRFMTSRWKHAEAVACLALRRLQGIAPGSDLILGKSCSSLLDEWQDRTADLIDELTRSDEAHFNVLADGLLVPLVQVAVAKNFQLLPRLQQTLQQCFREISQERPMLGHATSPSFRIWTGTTTFDPLVCHRHNWPSS